MIAVLGYAAILTALAGSVALVVTGIRASRSEDQDPASVRIPVLPPSGDSKPFQEVLIELGSRLKLPAFTNDDGSRKFRDYPDFVVNYETSPGSGIGFLAGWRGKGRDREESHLADLVQAFSPTALFFVGVLVGSGAFGVGVLLQTRFGSWSQQAIERAVLNRLPGYTILKSISRRVGGVEEGTAFSAALADIHGTAPLLGMPQPATDVFIEASGASSVLRQVIGSARDAWDWSEKMIVTELNGGREGLVFLLWGSYALKKGSEKRSSWPWGRMRAMVSVRCFCKLRAVTLGS